MASVPSTWRSRSTFVCNVLRALTGGVSPHSASSRASTVTSRGWIAASAVSKPTLHAPRQVDDHAVPLDAERPEHAHEHERIVPVRPSCDRRATGRESTSAMNHSTRTMRRLSVAAVALVGIGGAAVPGTSSVASAHRIRHVTYDAALQPTGGTAPCDPTTPARCVGTFENVITYTGGITGTSFAVGAAALAPDGIYRATAIEQFTGTIAGCGTGTVVIRADRHARPATGRSEGSWAIVAGAGSGDLATATGGSSHGRRGEPGKAWIRCR